MDPRGRPACQRCIDSKISCCNYSSKDSRISSNKKTQTSAAARVVKRSLAEFTTGNNRFPVADFKENESDVGHGSIVRNSINIQGKESIL